MSGGAVGGQALLAAGRDLDDVEVVVAHERDPARVGAPRRLLLLAGGAGEAGQPRARQVEHGSRSPPASRTRERASLSSAYFFSRARLPGLVRGDAGHARQRRFEGGGDRTGGRVPPVSASITKCSVSLDRGSVLAQCSRLSSSQVSPRGAVPAKSTLLAGS